eukprot:CAMPEP_0113373022 /NCGR_PEP_ID=MMETSP0013_2-20120614/842_1 /TAXON_ID=2843 ORGANISM="Skeletonema costatum, Strain 1716" /NCGR_SAMPLE_ID=MMETSP0013_2 /ASSEMBLY_ACC=CAM_ASM_000158 /LENGTH=450 /DNA_ID=CAMNT_0000254945 /DNA_START=122 /DNA_END=1470 /DNA_ORIENTATION=+ /assembly_acc=CAM_ASM_000158
MKNCILLVLQLVAVASCFSAPSKPGSSFSTSSSTTIPPPLEPRRNVASPDEDLRKMQQKHRPIAASFTPSNFNPHPALNNKHLQTIGGVFLRKNLDCAYVKEGVGGITNVLQAVASIALPSSTKLMGDEALGDDSTSTFWDERQRITSCCSQDFFSVDIKYASERKTTLQSVESNGLVVLIHGLESNSNSSLSTDMAAAYLNDGLDVVCINFRGCCGSPNDTIGGYHLGFTDDLKHFLKIISNLWDEDELFEKRPIYLSGFSLGANVVTKCLGELGEAALTLYNIHGAAVCGAPFDCERNIKYFESPGFNRAVYSQNFLKTLKKRAQEQLDQHCDGDPNTTAFDYQRAMAATTVAEVENAFIAPIYGFRDNIDYYRCTSCYYYLPGVAVPLYIINAQDDPFFDPEFYPIEETVDGGSLAPVKLLRTKHGGHLGYLFHQLEENETSQDKEA